MAEKEATPARKRGRGANPEETRQQLTDAAFLSLREDGFRGTTARAIATRASCNQAAIYYHFGGIDELLLAALEASSALRLERYRSSLEGITELPKLVDALRELYSEDSVSGHLAVLGELLGGVTANPDLREGLEASISPWLAYVEEKIGEVANTQPFGALVPVRDVADLVFSLIVGLEVRNKLDGDTKRADRLFDLAALGAAFSDLTS